MPQSVIAQLLNGWLVAATIMFALIALVTFHKSSRSRMDRNALIPFAQEEDDDGQA